MTSHHMHRQSPRRMDGDRCGFHGAWGSGKDETRDREYWP
jgi:hypothetical protein